MSLSESHNMLANQNMRVYNKQIMPNCWRASYHSIEGRFQLFNLDKIQPFPYIFQTKITISQSIFVILAKEIHNIYTITCITFRLWSNL